MEVKAEYNSTRVLAVNSIYCAVIYSNGLGGLIILHLTHSFPTFGTTLPHNQVR